MAWKKLTKTKKGKDRDDTFFPRLVGKEAKSLYIPRSVVRDICGAYGVPDIKSADMYENSGNRIGIIFYAGLDTGDSVVSHPNSGGCTLWTGQYAARHKIKPGTQYSVSWAKIDGVDAVVFTPRKEKA